MIGTKLAHFTITAHLGSGGMGDVYQATDSKLGRSVAIKVLPEAFSHDNDRSARFEREARVLASLNHPNIAAIYGIEQSGERKFLVMELVSGETLAERIKRGLIPIDEVLPIAKQIADGLGAAHEKGIIHRDLKPANIKVTSQGQVKVLDFGLAKAFAGDAAEMNLSNSPTLSMAATKAGVILGTAAYMSPEQAKGKETDRSTDIWAFGCVLYEMLTGRAAFEGETLGEILGSVFKGEPDWNRLPTGTPGAIQRMLRRALKKDQRQRLADIRDARIEIEEVGTETETGVAAVAPVVKQGKFAWIVAAVLLIGVLAMAVTALRRAGEVTPATGPVQFTIVPPENTSFGGPPGGGTGSATQVAVSPDGRNIVFVAGAQSAYQIWLRPVGTLTARPIPGTKGGAFPFWSPDSRFIGFFAGGKLKKVQITGGPPTELCDYGASGGRGGSWSRNNVILFDAGVGLRRVSSAGGISTVVTTVEPTAQTQHRWPYFLPDARHFIYTETTGGCCPPSKPAMIRIGSLDPAEDAITLLQAESSVSYASGHLLFARDGNLMAQPFDPDARQLKGDPVPLAEHVSTEGGRYVGASVSENGTLVYAHGSPVERELTWFDRSGRALGTLGEAGVYNSLALSPDERSVAVALRTGIPGNFNIWMIDIARNVLSRLTVDPGTDRSPVWSPDGSSLAFGGLRSGKVFLRQKLINGTATDESLFENSGTPSRPCGSGTQCNITPSSWSEDGRFIAYTLSGSFPRTFDVWILPLFGDRNPFPLIQTEFLETSGTFSPDGRWIAYTSDEAGRPNVYAQPFLRTGRHFQVSKNGGSRPVWRSDGKELFYLGLDGTMMAVRIDATGDFGAGVPQALFPTGAPPFNYGTSASDDSSDVGQVYAVTKDGQRFLVNAQKLSEASLSVVINWTAAIQK